MNRCILDPSYEATCPHPHLVCHHCHKRYCIGSYEHQAISMDYCPSCWHRASGASDLEGSVACIVPGCENRTNVSQFEGPLCISCADFIRGRKSPFSQASKNEIARFGEWLAKMQETLSTAGAFALSVCTSDTEDPALIAEKTDRQRCSYGDPDSPSSCRLPEGHEGLHQRRLHFLHVTKDET